MSVLKIKKLRESAVIPARATAGSAGFDLYADIDSEITVNSKECVKIPTGISIELESAEYGAFIFARSGLAIKYGLAPANCVGVIDSDYRGEIIVGLTNRTDNPYTIHKNERIAQMVIMPVDLPEIQVVDELDNTDRGSGGFGSTGN